MRTVGAVLDKSKGFGQGFDFLRVFLALCIVAYHAWNVADATKSQQNSVLWIAEYTLVPMFFALSGFLVAGSAIRLSLSNFLANRGLRIVPALAVEIFISALVIGPLVTTLTLSEYFSDPKTYHYFTNIIGIINYHLPGVFENHPDNRVNGALWTVPYEIGCYVFISGLILTGSLRRPKVVAALAFGLLGLGVFAEYSGVMNNAPHMLRRAIEFLVLGHKSRLLPSFLLGVLAFQIKDRIPYNKILLGACIASVVVIAFVFDFSEMQHTILRIFALPVLTYITVYIGVTKIPAIPLYSKGDYSYGIYLYHMPMEQLVYMIFPKSGLVIFLLTVPAITLFAMFSWHCIEKPILRLRKHFSFVAPQRGVVAEESKAS